MTDVNSDNFFSVYAFEEHLDFHIFLSSYYHSFLEQDFGDIHILPLIYLHLTEEMLIKSVEFKKFNSEHLFN